MSHISVALPVKVFCLWCCQTSAHLSGPFRTYQFCVFCHFLGFPPSSFASMCGSKDIPPYFEYFKGGDVPLVSGRETDSW